MNFALLNVKSKILKALIINILKPANQYKQLTFLFQPLDAEAILNSLP